MGPRKIFKIFISGLLVGVLTYLLYVVLERFVFDPVLCRESVALARCETKDEFASGVALLLGSMLGLVLLVRELVYRPILALLGVIISVWGIFSLLAVLPWFIALAVTIIVFGVSYVLFSWLVQPTSLYVALASVTVVVVIARLAANL
jgi:hypothetical protein